MEPVTDKFRLALTTDHVRTVRVEVLVAGDETKRVDLSDSFDSGQLGVSRQRIRRDGQLTFVDRDGSGIVVPKAGDQDALLAPYGNQLRIYSGLVYPDGSEELVCVGTLRITKSVSRYPRCTVEVKDRAWIVQNNTLLAPYQVAAGTTWEAAAAALLTDRYPGVPMDLPAVATSTTPLLTFDEQADPWEALQTMAASVGHALWFTPWGVATWASEVALSSAGPVWTFDGKPNANLPYDPADWANLALYDLEETLDSADAHNLVVITGSSSSLAAPVRGEAYDLDPSSPTRWDGPFGRKPLFESSELATTNEQALAMAQGRLQQVTGLAESLDIPAICNPALEVADLIQVIKPDLGVASTNQLDEFSLPLRGGPQQLSTRARRVVA